MLTFGENLQTKNVLDGGTGVDTLALRLTSAELARADVQAELKA